MPQIFDDEAKRVKALKEYNILDTLPEKDYDNITKLAAAICGTPIALISLIDEKRQFLKSHHGVDINETPREIAFCDYAIKNPNEILQIKDAREDERFDKNPLVTGPAKIVFYAGMPLVTSNGEALGSLCVIDNKVNALTNDQRDALMSLSNQVMSLLELRRKNIELKKVKKELELHAQNMEDFAYMAAHDLKEPLHITKSFIELLKEKHIDTLDEEDHQYFEYGLTGIKRMNAVIWDLLEYAKAGSGEIEYEEVDVEALVFEVLQRLTSELDESPPQLNFDNLPITQLPRVALKVVFQNLFSNAIKYCNKDITPEITITSLDLGDHIQFTVQDNGIGISKENLQDIFQAFKRVSNESAAKGSGLGLASCKKIINRLGGEIHATSIVNKGSLFTFTIKK